MEIFNGNLYDFMYSSGKGKDIIKKRIWENWRTKEYLERNHS